MEDIDKENKKRNGFEMLSDFFSNLDDSSTIDKDKHGSYNMIYLGFLQKIYKGR